MNLQRSLDRQYFLEALLMNDSSNPKAGETRDVDVEIYVSTFTANVHWSSITAIN
jgi:hypothetical protein